MADIGISEALQACMESILPEHEKPGQVRQPTGSILPGIAPANVHPHRQQRVGGDWRNQDAVLTRMAAVMGHPEWICEGGPFVTHEQRGERRLELDGLIAEWRRTLSTDIAVRYGRGRRTCRAHVHGGRYRV